MCLEPRLQWGRTLQQGRTLSEAPWVHNVFHYKSFCSNSWVQKPFIAVKIFISDTFSPLTPDMMALRLPPNPQSPRGQRTRQWGRLGISVCPVILGSWVSLKDNGYRGVRCWPEGDKLWATKGDYLSSQLQEKNAAQLNLQLGAAKLVVNHDRVCQTWDTSSRGCETHTGLSKDRWFTKQTGVSRKGKGSDKS